MDMMHKLTHKPHVTKNETNLLLSGSKKGGNRYVRRPNEIIYSSSHYRIRVLTDLAARLDEILQKLLQLIRTITPKPPCLMIGT